MAKYLPPSGSTNVKSTGLQLPVRHGREEMADLKIFWGPEICRLEYLVHLLDTGRIKDEHWRKTA
ncbi:MAG TPA: hypothetical protein VF221_16030 [Chloroflexota bacterium]